MKANRCRSICLVSFIVLSVFAYSAVKSFAQPPIVINADQPNIWTLEQAHYLLAQMHRRNLDLRARGLEDLDANAINGTNVEVLRTLLEVSAEFDATKGFTNNQIKNQKEFDAVRRQDLFARRVQLEDQSLELTRRIAEMKIEALKGTDTDRKILEPQIKELEIVQAAVKEQLNQVNAQIGTLSAVSGDFKSPTLDGSFDPKKFGGSLDSVFDSTSKKVIEQLIGGPQLNASLRLENYLQLQYEIISKQLTLLRDEVGAGERLIFLEIPQSINVSYDKADKKWAQSWWKVRGYTTCQEPVSDYMIVADQATDAASLMIENLGKIKAIINIVLRRLLAKQADEKRAGKALLDAAAAGARISLKTAKTKAARFAFEATIQAGNIKEADVPTPGTDGNIATVRGEITRIQNAAEQIKKQIEEMRSEAARLNIQNEADRFSAFTAQKKRYIRDKISDLLKVSEDATTGIAADSAAGQPIYDVRAILISTAPTAPASLKETQEYSKDLAEYNNEAVNVANLNTRLITLEATTARIAWLKIALLAESETDAVLKPVVDKLPNVDTTPLTVGENGILRGGIATLFTNKAVIATHTAANFTNYLKYSVLWKPEYRPCSRRDTSEVISDVSNLITRPGPFTNPEYINGSNRKIRFFGFERTDPVAAIIPPLGGALPPAPAPTPFIDLEKREVRVVDLFPRQSSLNVNDIKLRSDAFSLKFLFTLISGFGAKANYERQQEKYSQFIQQELYSSAFGKGSTEFGWTFNPMPGTSRLSSGVRTTYAIMVIPRKASSVILESTGCYFQRNAAQPEHYEGAVARATAGTGCFPEKSFIIPIPGGEDGENLFRVKDVAYIPVTKGKRIVVTIGGNDFSSQIGVVVNGVPLTQSLGLGQPFIVDDSNAASTVRTNFKNEKVRGSFERVSSDQILASFEIDDFEGIPSIALVAPGKALELNALNDIKVNNYAKPLKDSDYLFGKRVGQKEDEVKADKINVFQVVAAKPRPAPSPSPLAGAPTPTPEEPENPKLAALITGKNLDKVTKLYINGEDVTSKIPTGEKQSAYIRVIFDAPTEESIQATLITGEGFIQPSAVTNPAFGNEGEKEYLEDDKLTVTKAEFVGFQQSWDGIDTVAVFKLSGNGFEDDLVADKDGAIEVVSKEAALLAIPQALVPGLVILRSDKLTRKARIVVFLPPEAIRRRGRGYNENDDQNKPLLRSKSPGR